MQPKAQFCTARIAPAQSCMRVTATEECLPRVDNCPLTLWESWLGAREEHCEILFLVLMFGKHRLGIPNPRVYTRVVQRFSLCFSVSSGGLPGQLVLGAGALFNVSILGYLFVGRDLHGLTPYEVPVMT